MSCLHIIIITIALISECSSVRTVQIQGSTIKSKPTKDQLNIPGIGPNTVYFRNISTLARPGFVRMPLFERIEFNIFITKEPGYKKVELNQESEFFYSGDTHIPYILMAQDTITIEGTQNKDDFIYSLTTTDLRKKNRVNIFEEAIRNGIPLYYTEADNQRNKMLAKNTVLNNIFEISKIFKTAILFAERYCSNADLEFKEYFKDYLKFDYYVKLFTYCPNRKIIDSLFKIKYFDFSINRSNKYFNCNFAYISALYHSFTYKYNKKLDSENSLRTIDFIDSNFNKSESDLLKLFYLRNFAIKLIKEKPETFINAVNTILDTNYNRYLIKVYSTYKYQEKIVDRVTNLDGKEYELSSIIYSPANAIKYIDFWASWCAPCREEFKFYPNLFERIAPGQIEFITISLDQDSSRWKKALFQEQLQVRFKNYFYPNPSLENKSTLNLESIPRYLIVNKRGRVIDYDAPRPSDSALIPLLLKLVKDNN